MTEPDVNGHMCEDCGGTIDFSDAETPEQVIQTAEQHRRENHDGVRADGSQQVLATGTEPQIEDTLSTVYVVTANYADDPHPHVEAVYDNERAAKRHTRAIRDSIKASTPIAWGHSEVNVRDEVMDLDY